MVDHGGGRGEGDQRGRHHVPVQRGRPWGPDGGGGGGSPYSPRLILEMLILHFLHGEL